MVVDGRRRRDTDEPRRGRADLPPANGSVPPVFDENGERIPNSVRFPPPADLEDDAAQVWVEVIDQHHDPSRVVGWDLAAYCGQVATFRDARRRVQREGLIVEDERMRPIPHPAIAIEREAQRQIREWGDKFRGKGRR